MNTPAHVAVNLLFLGRAEKPSCALPICAGALLPDLPMFVFYFCARVILSLPERQIWRETYFLPSWQLFFDLFNSIPLVLAALLVTWRLKSPRGVAFFASMFLHMLFDFPLHHDDAHRHFLPLSTWRFESPVSYWDPSHYGRFVAPLEAVLVIVCTVVLTRRFSSRRSRVLLGALAALYALYGLMAFHYWGHTEP